MARRRVRSQPPYCRDPFPDRDRHLDLRRLAVPCLLLLLLAGPRASAHAEEVSPIPPTPRTLGQPPSYRVGWGPLIGYDFALERPTSRLYANITKPIFGAKLWWLDGTGEGAAEVTGGDLGAAFDASLGIAWFHTGIQYETIGDDLALSLSLRFPLRRGGLLGQGDMIRFDYLPQKEEFLAGMVLRPPFSEYRMTRPRETAVTLPAGSVPSRPRGRARVDLPEASANALEVARHSILWMSRMLTPHFDPDHFAESAADCRGHMDQVGHTFPEEDQAYHRALDTAFSAVLGDSIAAGPAMAARAESLIFREVLVPYDGALCEEKVPPKADGYCARALAAFQERRAPETGVALAGPLAASDAVAGMDSVAAYRSAACTEILRQVLEAIQDASSEAASRWGESFLMWTNRGALAWLPLNYGLRPAAYDSQEEWDEVVSRVAGEPFTDVNTIEYLMMEQFHLRLKQNIQKTQRYQVTIIHDFRGTTSDGGTDIYGWDVAVDGYVRAFIDAIRDIDAGTRDRLPQYFLLLDANYYQGNDSKEVLTFLEHLTEPLHAHFDHESVRAQVQKAQAELIDSIGASAIFGKLDKRTIRAAFRVQVGVTGQFDPAFALDVTRRDHRKVAFCDVFEDDPGSGEAVFTGQGIGEHYNGSGWEDRGIVVRGTSLVALKSMTRRLLLQQGYREREIPYYLEARPYPPDYERRCAALRDRGWTTPAAVLVNETGYGVKQASALKAAIYNLAPPGSYLLSFDSLWSSEFWAGMFVSAALRGANAFVVGPTPTNAPSAAKPTLYFLRRNLRMLVEASDYFSNELSRSGGALRVGLYAHNVPTNDFRRRTDAFLAGRQQYPFLRDAIPTDSSVDSFLVRYRELFPRVPLVALQLRPWTLLHLKCQLFATAEAFRINGLPEWADVLQEHLRRRQDQSSGRSTVGIAPDLLTRRGPRSSRSLVEAFDARLAGLSPEARNRAIFMLTVGSHNQNPRSMELDGEDLVAVAGVDGAITIIDMAFILCVAEYPANPEEFDAMFPEQNLPFYMRPLRQFLKVQG
jgi:hypothetical protein